MKKLLLFIALTIFGLGLNAQYVGDETTIDYDGYSLAFRVTSVEPAECKVSGYMDYPTDVIIPSNVTISGTEFNVTSIGSYAFNYCSSLTSIEIPSSVTEIYGYAFESCSSLRNVTFEENSQLITILDKAFYDCSSLTSIEIPNSVTYIENRVFYGCSSLESITFGENSQLASIGESAFWECSSLASIEIPNSVTSIGDGAFGDCSSITSIIVVEGNTIYDSRENCNAIIETTSNTLIVGCQNTVIPNTVTSIGNKAFWECSSLASIEIPNSVTSIGELAFSGCSGLASIEIPNSVTSIGKRAFSDSNLKSIVIPNSVTSIGIGAFENCSSLTSIEIPNSVTSIGYWAFNGCSSLRVITCYAENIPETGSAVFNDCPSDMTIYVPEVSLEDYKSASPWNAFTILSLNEGPRNIIATTDSAFSVNLSWDNCYADSYNVYRNGDSIANVTNPTYTDIDLEYNTEYCYTVTAVRNEIESDKSEEKCVKTFDLPITTPENLVAEALSTSSISLSWDAVENALSYNVYQANEMIANVEETTFTVDSLEYNTEYCYTVTAVRNETESDKSEEKCAKTFDLPITTPENLVAEALSTSSIILTWDNVENALSYNIYQSNKVIANVEETTFTVDGLEYNTEYCYTVTAVSNDEESDKSEEKCAKTFDLPITTPENLVAEALSTSSIILTWDNVENALSYNVYQANELIANVEETTFTVDGLEYNTEYCYTVTAVRNETESDKSEEKCAKTFDLPITTPENLIANVLSTSSIILTWDNVENALSYNVYQADELIANVEETTFTVDSLEYNTEYCYTVTAVRNETESDKSEEKCAKTFDLPITTPENLIANVLSTSSIILTWDNVENALSYNVYRDGEMIINVTNTNYTDNNLEYNTEYCYTVTAVRNETESDKSEEVCAKTLGESINELSSSINIYPNPVENELFIATEVRVEKIAIYDIYGRQTISLQVNETTSQQVVEVADLEAGVYFVNVVTNAGEIVKRFVKK